MAQCQACGPVGSTLAAYAYQFIGDRPVDRISHADVIGLLSPIWTGKPETARRVGQRVRAVMAKAIALEYIEHNPAGEGIDAALARLPGVKAHHAALPYAQLPAAMRAVRESPATHRVYLTSCLKTAFPNCRRGQPLMDETARHNEVGCKVMMEIVH